MKSNFTFVMALVVLMTGFLSMTANAAGVCGYARNCWYGGGCWDSRKSQYASAHYCGADVTGGHVNTAPRGSVREGVERITSSSSNCHGTLVTAPEYGRNPHEGERYINCSVENCAGKTLRTPNSRKLITCY